MATEPALVCRLLASSVSIAHKAGKIIRDIFHKGDLNVVEKVNIFTHYFLIVSYGMFP